MANGQRTEHVRYVVVVHGIGDQRKNQTMLEVINRFAEVRAGSTRIQEGDPLTLGMLSGQTSDLHPLTGKPNPWVEFKGIPADPTKKPQGVFMGHRVDDDEGNNIRFVDICWADVMREQFPDVGEDVAVWSLSLIERLKRNPMAPAWVVRLITVMRKAVVLVKKIMLLKFPSATIKIFNDYLGDAQLYGEYGPCRGLGVRRFHDIMASVQAAHNLEQDNRRRDGKAAKESRYTIIAHSLGSIMSLDALFYACTRRDAQHPGGPRYEGYRENLEEQDPLDSAWRWLRNTDAFVTLGSPIDKYLVLWPSNYRHLITDAWVELPTRDGRDLKIRHFNYSDEQDPVGGELDIARSTPAFRKVFETYEDMVFTRYAVPGAAHNAYWKDLQLFEDILDRAVDNPEQKKERLKRLNVFVRRAYHRCLRINYLWIPFAFWVISSFALTLTFYADSAHTQLVAGLGFVAAILLARWVIQFVIEGRQIVIVKLQDDHPDRKKAANTLPQFGTIVATVMIAVGCLSLSVWRGWIEDPFKKLGVYQLPSEYWLGIFLWALVGVAIVLYALSTYCRFRRKLRRLMSENIKDYAAYVNATIEP